MAIKLMAFDLDGTLLTSDKHITERTLAAIDAAKAKGVYVTIATGRMFCSAEYFAKLIHGNAPVICCNGGVVQEIGAAEPLCAHYLPEEVVRRMLTVCYEQGWYVNWYIGNDILVPQLDWDYFYAYKTTQGMRFKEVGAAYLSYTKQVVQCVLRDLTGHVEEKGKELYRLSGGGFSIQQNTCRSMDLSPIGVDKGVGLKWLAEDYLGLTRDEVMACGDSENDLAMLRYAGTAVVPENGLPVAKELATYAAASNDEDGIARAIEELVL